MRALALLAPASIALASIALPTGALGAGAGSSGAEFLRVPMGARAAALGENFTGLADDVTAAAWNPAGLGQLKKIEMSAMHMTYLGDTSYEFLAASVPFGDLGSVAVSGIYLNMKPFDSTAPGSGAARGEAADGMAALSWGGSLKPILPDSPEYHSVFYGVTGKFIYRSLGGYQPSGGTPEKYTATAVAADLGILHQLNPDLSWGISVLNIGTRVTFLGDESDALPLSVRGGVGLRAYENDWLRAVLLADAVKPVDTDGGKFKSGTWGGAGCEATFKKMLALRFGFRSGPDGARPVGGVGFSYRGFSLDCAYTPLSELGAGLRFGLSAKIGVKPPRLKAVTSLSAEVLPQSKVMIKWAPLAGAGGYFVGMKRPGEDGFTRVSSSPRRAPELVLGGLKPGIEYAFQVVAVDERGIEGKPSEVRRTIPPAVTALATPTKLAASSVVSRTAVITWAPVAGCAGYNVYFRRTAFGKAGAVKAGWRKVNPAPRKTTRIFLKGLSALSYDYTVAAVDAAGKAGKGCRPVTIRIKP